jgi:stage II sporulation protein GA (sporulation sigma-E factor processing peptidase)
MPVYLDVLVLLNFLVDLLLLIGTNRLSGYAAGVKRAVPAALLGGAYGGVCILPGLEFLAGTVFRVLVLAVMGIMAFGAHREAGRRCVLFVLLSMALGGVAVGLQSGFWSLILCAGAVCLLCVLGFRGRLGQQYVPIKVPHSQGTVEFMALRDTGNTLTDPMTGQQILVVSPRIGMVLTGLTRQQLERPSDSVGVVPGLRLIPFHAVGKSGGVLAAKRFEDVTIGSWRGSCLIAFAPNDIGQGKPYEALTGGV